MKTLRELAEEHKDNKFSCSFEKDCKNLTITLADIRDLIQDENHSIRFLGRTALVVHQNNQHQMVAQQLALPPDHALFNFVTDFSALCNALIKTDLRPEHCRIALIQHLAVSETTAQQLLKQLMLWYQELPSPIIKAIAETFKGTLNAFTQHAELQTRLLDYHMLGWAENKNTGLAFLAEKFSTITIARIEQFTSEQLTVAFNLCDNVKDLPEALQKSMCLRAIEVCDTPDQLKSKLHKLVIDDGSSLIPYLIRVKEIFVLSESQVERMVETLVPSFKNSDIFHMLTAGLLTPQSIPRSALLQHFNVSDFLDVMTLTQYKAHHDTAKGRTHADKDNLVKDFTANTSHLPTPYLQKILEYLKDSKRCRNDTSTFVTEMRLPNKGSCRTTRMAKFTHALEARITHASLPPSTSGPNVSTTTNLANLASTNGGNLSAVIATQVVVDME